MKKLYLLFALLLSSNSFSQSELIGEWFLHSITENGSSPITTFPYNYTLNFNINSTDNSIYDNYGNMQCNYYEAFSTFPSVGIVEIQVTLVTLAYCNSPHENLYLTILGNFSIDTFNYSIVGAGNDETLTLINSNSDVLIYGRQALSISDNILNELSVSIVENPVKENLQLDFKDLVIDDLTYSIFSINGKIMINTTHFNDENIKVSLLSSGIYFLRIVSLDNRSKILKFIKN